jgi:cytochrome c peroxidase
MRVNKIIIVFAGSLFFYSCRVDPKIIAPLPSNNLEEVIPEGWPQPVYRFKDNPVSENTFILGRALFYEPALSKDNSVSCGTCHQLFAAFANLDHELSHGINNLEGTRNSPGIFNLAWHPSFMHDGGINHIEVQPIAPITNPVEMGEDLNNVIAKLQASEKYRQLFKNAFGSDEINTQRMMRSMAQFMALAYSYNSKYDQFKRGEKGVQLNEQEMRGYSLFLANCNTCHKEPLFTDFSYRNNGLSVDPLLNDSGRARITRDPEDLYRFKMPSLRNVGLTYPYMHDGRYLTLEDCLDHYTNSVTNTTNLDPALKPSGLNLSPQDKKDLIAFLHTLSDFKFINDQRFAEPKNN